MSRIATFMATVALVTTVTAASAQESDGPARQSLPGSVFVIPQGGETPVDPDTDPEIVSDIGIFRAKGFEEPDWQTHTSQVDEVLKNVVLPDWRTRTGSETDPDLPSIDIAAASILGGKFNDLLVMSRLPGDCSPEGCLFQIYSLVNDVWVKRFEFKTVAFAWKEREEGEVVIARVGGMWVPSKTHIWKDQRLH